MLLTLKPKHKLRDCVELKKTTADFLIEVEEKYIVLRSGQLKTEDVKLNDGAFSGADMTKPFLDKPTREKIVANTLASLRIENLRPSDSLKLGLQDYIEGKKATEDLLAEVKAKYVTVRRRES